MSRPPTGDRSGSALPAVVWAVARRPDLWWSAFGVVRRLAPPGWWRASPRLPLPDRRLWEFRMVTAYGSPDAAPRAPDVISYLEWCRTTGRSDRRCGRRS